jgi:hypothetical protein
VESTCEGAQCDEPAGGAEAVGETSQAAVLCADDYQIGVIMGDTSYTTKCGPNNEWIQIHMDDEDSSNADSRLGWIGAIQSTNNTTFWFCRVDGRQFYPMTTGNDESRYYAVLKLGTHCPNGSEEFVRHFDNEDSSNANAWSSQACNSIAPNEVHTDHYGYTDLHFCLFRSGQTAMQSFPSLGFSYGVFTTQDTSLSATRGHIYTDDEDGGDDQMSAPNPGILPDAEQIVVPGSGGQNTFMYMAKMR